jgi:hypothetical protein
MLEQLYQNLTKKTEKYKKELLDDVNEFLDELETEDGLIKRDMAAIGRFEQKMDSYFKEFMVSYLAFMALTVRESIKYAASRFAKDGVKPEDVAFFEEFLGIKGNKILPERKGGPTVLYATAEMRPIRQDFINKLQSAMVSDSSMKDFRNAINKTVSRRFYEYFEIPSTAALFNTYNAVSYHLAKENRYTKFRYEGGLISESRDFCIERDGHEFFIEEGKSWNKLDWKGKIAGVDFFVQTGGYNCRHWLVFIKD